MTLSSPTAGAYREDMSAWLEWTDTDARSRIAVPGPLDDKYSRGVLGVITGSVEYPGAAILGVEAAHRTGVGMVRYVGPRFVRSLVLARRPEVVTQPGRVQAWLVGSGMDAARRSFVLVGELTRAISSGEPVVIDAAALDLVAAHTGPTIITPHYRELASLLTKREIDVSAPDIAADPSGWAVRAAIELDVVVLLKGASTFVADPVGQAIVVRAGTNELATAGTGDVLGGILGSLLATHAGELRTDLSLLAPLAATAALIHGRAAERASGGGPIAALDVAEALPATIAALTARP